MIDYTYELERLEEGDRSPELMERIVKKHKDRAEKMKALYDRFTTDELPIKERTLKDPMKINNRINHDFVGEIINTKVGYFAGIPAQYSHEKDEVNKFLKEFSDRNRLGDLDAEMTKIAGIAGYCPRMMYIDKKGKERIATLKPWNVVLLGENGMDEADYALYYYDIETNEGKESRIEFYAAKEVIEYRMSGNTAKYEEVQTKLVNLFDYCPVWGYMNNEELLGDFERAVELIDAYDRGVSDVNSELEAFRGAYLALYGIDPPETPEDEEGFAKAGTMYFPPTEDGKASGKAEFVTKVIQDGAIENHLTRLAKDIYKFTFTPDMSDQAFGGTVTGVAARYKIMAHENKTAGFERKTKSGNIRMFELLASAAGKRNVKFDPFEIEQKFKRNFPQDLKDMAETATELKGNLPHEAILAKTGLSDNPREDAEAVKAEQEAYALNDATLGGEGGGFGEVRKKTNEPAE